MRSRPGRERLTGNRLTTEDTEITESKKRDESDSKDAEINHQRRKPDLSLPADFPQDLNKLSGEILGAAIEVHRQIGPGLLESIYEVAFDHELHLRGIAVERQVPVAVKYKDIQIGGQRLDLLVKGKIIVELKTVEFLTPVHEAQIISYLKASGLRLGLLINFNVPRLIDGVRRFVL